VDADAPGGTTSAVMQSVIATNFRGREGSPDMAKKAVAKKKGKKR
jgi:hypothetical protein